MARVIVTSAHNFAAIANLAGSTLENLSYHEMTDELEVPDVSQSDLDAAFADYTANQVARDASWTMLSILPNLRIARQQTEFDDREVLRAFAKLIMNDLNTLRALHSLPPRTFAQLRTEIRNEIANP